MSKKYYTLYKIERHKDGRIKDLRYIYEVADYDGITEHLNITRRTIAKMLNNKITDNWDNLKQYGDYTIIKER